MVIITVLVNEKKYELNGRQQILLMIILVNNSPKK